MHRSRCVPGGVCTYGLLCYRSSAGSEREVGDYHSLDYQKVRPNSPPTSPRFGETFVAVVR